METATLAARRLTRIWSDPPTLYGWLATVDHKKIGKRDLATAMGFLAIGGVEALLMRAQLLTPGSAFLAPEAYNQVFTMHGVTMIFWYAARILAGFVNAQSLKPGVRMPSMNRFDGATLQALSAYLQSLR